MKSETMKQGAGVVGRMSTGLFNSLLEMAAGFFVSSHPEWSARNWSNRELRRLGPLFAGDILNLSGWKDGDKQGGRYRDYFPNAKSYAISNFGVEIGSSGTEEKEFDLSKPADFRMGTYDLVFSHTVLEHVYPTKVVFDNLAMLSRDAILTVVPFVQQMHGVKDAYVDYFRYSPLALERLLEERGFKTIYVSWNDDHPLMNVYLVHVASRYPERHKDGLPASKTMEIGQTGPGMLWPKLLWPRDNERSFCRKIGDVWGRAVRPR